MSEPDERLRALNDRLRTLEQAPVAEHPDVLDEVHAALVAELDGLTGRPGEPRDRRGGA